MPAAPFRTTTEAGSEAAAKIPDLVRRNFTADRPGVKFVGNITYIHTWQGFVYLATVFDCYSKKVEGWSIADHTPSERVETAHRNAASTVRIEPGAIWHSDRGSQYTSASFRALVKDLDPHSSMGRTGVGQGRRGVVLLGLEERARIPHGLRHQGPGQAGRDPHIEGFYNSRRRHSAVDYRYPNEVHYSYQQPSAAA